MPTRLLFIRHGQTAWNAERRFLGRTDLPLDEVGLAQARAARIPAVAALYTSALSRAKQTAEALGAPIVEAGLEELDQGDLEGRGADAIESYPEFFRAWALDPTDIAAPGASESLGDLVERATAAVLRIAARHPGETVGICSHQLVIASLTCLAHGTPLASWRQHRLENLGTVELGVEDGRLTA